MFGRTVVTTVGSTSIQYDCDCDVDTIEVPVLTTAWWSTMCVRVCGVRANIGPMCLWSVACGGSIVLY